MGAVKSKRVFVIGLDGVPFDLLRRWADQGELPVLGGLIEHGVGGSLASTLPPTSGPAWSSIATGKNPGKTGIFDFLHRRPGSYVFPPINSSMRRGKSLWRILSDAGRRVAVVNIPISYPVEEVDGIMISGWMTPYFAKDFTFPRELAAEIVREVGDYRIYPSETFSEGRKESFFKACDELLDLLTETNLYLMKKQDWDFFMTVYFDTDRVLHQLWHYLDEDHPWRQGRDGDLSAPVLRYFKRLDASIGRLLDRLDDDTTVLLVSDHGMGRASRFIVLNNLLMQLGFIKLASDPVTRAKAFAFRRGLTLRNVHRMLDLMGMAKHAEYKNVYSFDPMIKRFFLSFLNVDWQRTSAYSFGRHYGSIYLNVAGREPQGIVSRGSEYERVRDELAEALLSYVDPKLGRPLVGKCLKREDVYSGECLDEAPDLIALPYDESDIFFGLADFGSNRIWDQTYRYSGMHRDHGLFIGKGPEIKRGEAFEGGAVVDLAPTILHLLGLEIPCDMDGSPLLSAFTDEFRREFPVRKSPAASLPSGPSERDYSPEEEAEIMGRLRDLGYLN